MLTDNLHAFTSHFTYVTYIFYALNAGKIQNESARKAFIQIYFQIILCPQGISVEWLKSISMQRFKVESAANKVRNIGKIF